MITAPSNFAITLTSKGQCQGARTTAAMRAWSTSAEPDELFFLVQLLLVSLEVVKVVALLCHLPEPAPECLETMEQRRTWLEKLDKPIVFCFTPKHASWLNPIEMWFGLLCRKALRRGSFRSLDDLREKVEAFRAYYNERMAYPYRIRPWAASKAATAS